MTIVVMKMNITVDMWTGMIIRFQVDIQAIRCLLILIRSMWHQALLMRWMTLNLTTVFLVALYDSIIHVLMLWQVPITGICIMYMVLGITFTIRMIHGIGIMDGNMVGLGGHGTAGMEVFGDGIVLMLGHIGDGDLAGAPPFMA